MKAGSQSHIQPWHLVHKSKNAILFSLFLLVVSLVVTESGSLVKTLPGFPGDLPFKLETGYISVGKSDEVQYFYYFFESERNPENDPLVLWVRGGPGCSAFRSILSQIGPFTLNFSNSTLENPIFELSSHSLTKVANIIFLDEPAGSGYSYGKSYEAYLTNDTLTKSHTHQFIRKWLMDHSKFVNNPFYFGDDSYSGILVPMVIQEILDGNDGGEDPHINIKGYILGNPLTDIHEEQNSKIEQAHRMALLSDKIYESVKKSCHGEYLNVDPNNTLCINDLQVVEKCIERVNSPNVLVPECDTLNTSKPELFRWGLRSLDTTFVDIWSSDEVQTQRECNLQYYMEAWTNRRDVQEALHISKDFSEIKWIACNKTMNFDLEVPGKSYNRNVVSTVAYHQQLSHKNLQVLVYSGDQDMDVPYFASLKWIKSLNLLLTSNWRPWYVDEQVSGYTMTYSNNHDYRLSFATIKGAGHTSADDKPQICINMFLRWLANEDL